MKEEKVPVTGIIGGSVEQKLSPEKVCLVLSAISRRLDFLHRKMERYHPEGQKMSLVEPGQPDLSPRELSKLWEAMRKFSPSLEEMDSVVNSIMNKDGKI